MKFAARHCRHRNDQHAGPQAEDDLRLAQQVERVGISRMTVNEAFERLGREGVDQRCGKEAGRDSLHGGGLHRKQSIADAR